MTYKFETTEKANGRIAVVFKNSTEQPLRLDANDFYLGRFDQKSISVKEQQQATAALMLKHDLSVMDLPPRLAQ